MAISKETMDKLIQELDRAHFVYHYVDKDENGNIDKNIKGYRTFDNTEDYVCRFNTSEFIIYLASKKSTALNEQLALEALKNIKIKNLAYEEKRMIHNLAYPDVHELSHELMKEVLEVFSSCQHLTQAKTSKVENDANMLSYLNINSGIQYRLYLEQKGVAIILNSTDLSCLDEKEVKKLLNMLKIHEYEYHKKLEEFNLKAKDEPTHHDMQLKAVI
jgi:GGDEF domain-containing protein